MTKKIILGVCILLFTLTGNLFSQKTDSTKHLFCSFGVRANTFVFTDLLSNNVPATRLQFNIDPIKYLRLETHYGFYKSTKDNQISTGLNTFINYPTETKSSILSFGLFGMIKKEKTNFYIGFRYSRVSYSDQNLTSSPTGDPFVTSNTGVANLYSGVLGGEYFLGRRFTLGGELAFVSKKDVYSPFSFTPIPSSTTKNSLTETSIILRFYPF